MAHRRIGLVLTAIIAGVCLLAASCSDDDDGATVRDLDDTSGESSESASASEAASGSASASAPASGTTSGTAETGPTDADGGYEYASDVSSHRLVVLDICEIAGLLDADPVDFDAAGVIYRDGVNSVNSDGSIRSTGGFATSEEALHGLDVYYRTPTPLDDFVTSALEGSDQFAGSADGVRAQGVEKGIQNQVMVAWTRHELNSALAKAEEGEFDPAEGAPHNWDEAWAFFHGAEPACSPYATADKRAADFGTLASDGETSLANEATLAAMTAGRDALLAGDLAGAQAAADEVVRNIVITYSQAAIRYATLAAADVAADDQESAAEHQAEGLAFWMVIEAIIALHGGDVVTVNEIFDLANEPGSGDGDVVRAALEPAWDSLGITEEDIGTLS